MVVQGYCVNRVSEEKEAEANIFTCCLSINRELCSIGEKKEGGKGLSSLRMLHLDIPSICIILCYFQP